MSIAQVEKALTDFAVHNKATAIVLKGEWGTGKTYIWDKVIKEHKENFCRSNYSYVSLFGLNSLADLKRSIFENSMPCAKAGQSTSVGSITQNLKKLDTSDIISGMRKALSFGKEAKIPYVGSVGGVIDSLQFALIKNTIICIDDFERRGNALSARDVLGLISNLNEKKECSIILILNEGSLQKDDEFFTFFEKVFDFEIKYAPTIDEAVSVVFDLTNSYEIKIIENIKKLKISNIRLLRKVKYFAGLIRPFIDQKSDEIINESASLIPLAIYAKYAGSYKVIDIDDLENYNGGLSLIPPEKKELTENQSSIENNKILKNNFFHEYGYGEADDFTLAIINLVKNGYADQNSLSPLIDSIAAVIERNKKREIISNAWHAFHNDITISDEDLLVNFEMAVYSSGDSASPYEIDGIYEIFIAVGLESRGKALVDAYFVSLGKNRPINHKRELYKSPTNPYVVEKLEQYFEAGGQVLSLDELMDEFHNNYITSELMLSLSVFTEDQFYSYFKKLSSLKFVSYARSLLSLASRVGLPMQFDYYENVFLKTFSALKRMHDESPLMALRMNKFMEYQQIYEHKISQLKNQ